MREQKKNVGCLFETTTPPPSVAKIPHVEFSTKKNSAQMWWNEDEGCKLQNLKQGLPIHHLKTTLKNRRNPTSPRDLLPVNL